MSKSKKLLAVFSLILAMVVVFTVAGCSQEQAEEPGDQIIIGFNQGSSTIDFLKKVGDNIALVAGEKNVKFIFAESNFDPEQIMSNVESLLLQGAQVIIDFNVNGEVGGNIVEVCAAQGVPVIGIDVKYISKDGDESWFFGANNLESGKVAGRALSERVVSDWDGQIDKLVLFFNSENGDEVKKRLSGIYDGLIESGEVTLAESDVVYIDMGGGGSDTTLVGMQKLTDFLTAHPDLKHIGVGTVNDQTAQGCFSATQNSNRESDVFIVSHGCDSPSIENLKLPQANCWIGSTAYFPERYGEYIVPLALDILAGKNPPKLMTMEHLFITRDNISEFYPN